MTGEEGPSLIPTDALLTCGSVVGSHRKALVSVSGGSDSDIMIDLVSRAGVKDKCVFVFYDTGLEYAATKRHLDYLEGRYGIRIERARAKVPVPVACRRHGVPFLSKYVSARLEELQAIGFDFADGGGTFEELYERYGRRAKKALRWWTNDNGERSRFNIDYKRCLKEFMMANPPSFKISAKCCDLSKKDTADEFDAATGADLKLIGVRKAEKGIRSTVYKSCFSRSRGKGPDMYRPVFWFTNGDKAEYEREHGIVNSDCYTVWGLRRTGCTGCPCNIRMEQEFDAVSRHEPKMAKACRAVFGEVYAYTAAYKAFRRARLRESRGQSSLDDFTGARR